MDTMLGLLLLLTTTATLLVQSSNGDSCKFRVCYFKSDANGKDAPQAQLLPEDIDPTLCSHIMYNNVYLRGNDVLGYLVYYKRVLKLKEKVANLKVLLTLQGFDCDYGKFLEMAGNKNSRSEFIANIIKYLRKQNSDGVNIYCVFNKYSKIDPKSKQALSDLVAELRQAFDKEATGSNRLLLSLNVFGERIIDDTCYDIHRISQNVDWINLLADDVDLNLSRFNTTRHHNPLFADATKGQVLSVELAVSHWIKQHTPRQKIVIAVPSFGRHFTLTSEQTDEGAPATDGVKGPFTNIPGLLAYYEICSLIQATGTTFHRPTIESVPYLVSGNQWVGYDDVDSVIERVTYLKNAGLGGFALTDLDMDDFKGAFCGQGLYPLLRAANKKCSE